MIEPIEEQVNGVEDMIYMSSNASNSGSANITVTFAVGTDGQKNTQNTQSRVNWALSQLPEAVQREGVIVQEQSGNILLAITLDSPDGSYDSLFSEQLRRNQYRQRTQTHSRHFGGQAVRRQQLRDAFLAEQ
ncbi:MAG: efflux RND transporter permease subunit [Victivallales bacterium]